MSTFRSLLLNDRCFKLNFVTICIKDLILFLFSSQLKTPWYGRLIRYLLFCASLSIQWYLFMFVYPRGLVAHPPKQKTISYSSNDFVTFPCSTSSVGQTIHAFIWTNLSTLFPQHVRFQANSLFPVHLEPLLSQLLRYLTCCSNVFIRSSACSNVELACFRSDCTRKLSKKNSWLP